MNRLSSHILSFFLGGVTTILGLFFLVLIIFIGMNLSLNKDKFDGERKGIWMSLGKEIVDETPMAPMDYLQDVVPYVHNGKLPLPWVRKVIHLAKDDSKIEYIVLSLSGMRAGASTLEVIREDLKNFKNSGKKIYMYFDSVSVGSLFLSSVATDSSVYPLADVDFSGMVKTPFFFKKSFEKLGITPRIFRAGKFKSFVEMFQNEKMSEENRKQSEELLFDTWDYVTSEIAQAKGLSGEYLKEKAYKGSYLKGKDLLQDKLALNAESFWSFKKRIWDDFKLGEAFTHEDFEKRHFGIRDYLKEKKKEKKQETVTDETPKIALLTLEGEIVFGMGEGGDIAHKKVLHLLEKTSDIKNLKGIVVRINSPGGSTVASDIIWNALKELSKKVPLYISLGDMAASGGIYLAMAGEKIWAQKMTITGSIGVFLLNFQATDLAKKIGVNFDRVATGPLADLGNPMRDLSDKEKEVLQRSVDEFYQEFIAIVKESRGERLTVPVEQLAQGRVWSGLKAKEFGLIDEFGGLKETLETMKKDLGGGEFKVVKIKDREKGFRQFFNLLT